MWSTTSILLAFGVLILVVGTTYVVVRPRINRWGASAQEHLSTRLLIRCRGNSPMARLQGPVQFVMQHKMMLGIKRRAEQRDFVMNRSGRQSREAN